MKFRCCTYYRDLFLSNSKTSREFKRCKTQYAAPEHFGAEL